MSNNTRHPDITLPVKIIPNPLYSNNATYSRFQITLGVDHQSESQNLIFPSSQGTGYLFFKAPPIVNINNTAPTFKKTVWRTATSAVEYKDSEFQIQNAADTSKVIVFDAGSISNGTTRTITMPDIDVDLGIVDMLKNITVSEANQLIFINTYPISTVKWGYLSQLDQSLQTTSDVTFNNVNIASAIFSQSTATKFQVGNTSNTGKAQMWFTGSVDPDPDNADNLYANLGPICRLGSLTAVGDATNIISEGFRSYGTIPGGGQMLQDNFCQMILTSNTLKFAELYVGLNTTPLVIDATKFSWHPPGMLTDLFYLDSTRLTNTLPLTAGAIRLLSGVLPQYVNMVASPNTSYTVPFPDDPPFSSSYGGSRLFTDGTTSTWENLNAIPNINLYYYPSSYVITGGGTALKDSIALHGGGIAGAPVVYEIADSLTYTAGIDLTNNNHIIIRGAVDERPIIATDAANPYGCYIIYDGGAIFGITADIIIGNLIFDCTGPGTADQTAILCWRKATANNTDGIDAMAFKDIEYINTDMSTTGISRGGLVIFDEYTASGDFWVNRIYAENCIYRNLTPRINSGAPMLMGIQQYYGKKNSYLYPDLTSWGADIAQNYYWIRGSNVIEMDSYFSQGAYSGATASDRYLCKISQDNLYSSWNNNCTIEFTQCSFSNNVESTTGAIILSHNPTGTPGGVLQPISLIIRNCSFLDIKGASVYLIGDSINHGALVTLIIEDNNFSRCDYAARQSSTFISSFADLSIENNKYDACLGTDVGFSTGTLQQAIGKDLMAYSSMYKYFDQVDYTTWSASSTAYFTTTTSFALGEWYTVDLMSGLPAVGWDLGPSNRITQEPTTGVFTILEDGLYQIKYSISMINFGATTYQQWESYIVIDSETPPVAAPAGNQKQKMNSSLQLSTTDNKISACSGKHLMQFRQNQTLCLAIRWVAGGGPGAMAYMIQSAKIDILKMSK